MSGIDLSLIPNMLMDVFKNPDSLHVFWTVLTNMFYRIVFNLLWLFVIIAILYYIYLYYKEYWFKKPDREKLVFVLKIWLERVKKPFYGLRYFFIWIATMFLSWPFVSRVFYFVWTAYPDGVNIWHLPEQEAYLIGYRAFLSLIIFMLPPYFITFSFGNKFVRNIWIFIYILGIAFILLGGLLNLKNVSYI